MSEKDDILKEVTDIIADKLAVDVSKITPTAKFIEDLGADSLDTIELVMAIEEKFDIEIPDEDAEKIVNLDDAVKFIEAAVEK